MMKHIILTGFDSFNGEEVNPSWQAVEQLPEEIGGARVHKLILPVCYDTCFEPLKQAIEQYSPDVVICVGQAGGRAVITPEYVAINVKDAAIADNAGVMEGGDPIIKDGDNAWFTTLPVRKMIAAMKNQGIPAALSYTAGEYVCNNLFYHVRDYIEQNKLPIKAGFIHVPYSCEQIAVKAASAPSLPLERITKGLEICAAIALTLEEEV